MRVSYLDGHSSAVEAHGEQSAATLRALEGDHELGLAKRKCMAKMETAVHVRIGESGLWRGLSKLEDRTKTRGMVEGRREESR